MASQFPVWFAGKPFLTSSPFVIEVKDQAGLIAAEFQTTPGSWKLFPYTSAGEASASTWAGVKDPGSGGSAGEGVAAPEAAATAASAAESAATAIPDFLSRLTSGALWIRIAEVLAGVILIGIGLNSMLKGKPMGAITGTAGVVGKAAMF